jgi:hypothetical protein
MGELRLYLGNIWDGNLALYLGNGSQPVPGEWKPACTWGMEARPVPGEWKPACTWGMEARPVPGENGGTQHCSWAYGNMEATGTVHWDMKDMRNIGELAL